MNAQALLSRGALLIVIALCGSILGFQIVTGVPPLSSTAAEGADVIALLKRARLPEQAVIYELGSGWGSLVFALARAFPTAQIRGLELSPLPYWVSRLRTRNLPNVQLRRRDFYRFDLSDESVSSVKAADGHFGDFRSIFHRYRREHAD